MNAEILTAARLVVDALKLDNQSLSQTNSAQLNQALNQFITLFEEELTDYTKQITEGKARARGIIS